MGHEKLALVRDQESAIMLTARNCNLRGYAILIPRISLLKMEPTFAGLVGTMQYKYSVAVAK